MPKGNWEMPATPLMGRRLDRYGSYRTADRAGSWGSLLHTPRLWPSCVITPLEGRDHRPERTPGMDADRMGRKPCLGGLVHRTAVVRLLAPKVQGESCRLTFHPASVPACHWRQRAADHRGFRVRHAAARMSPSGGESPPASGGRLKKRQTV